MRNRHIMAISDHSISICSISYNRRPSEEQLMECPDMISWSLNFRASSSHLVNTYNTSLQNFPFNQRRADEYVQLKGMFNNCIIGSTGCVKKGPTFDQQWSKSLLFDFWNIFLYWINSILISIFFIQMKIARVVRVKRQKSTQPWNQRVLWILRPYP